MEKRLLVAVLLMSAVIMLTNVFFPPQEPQPTPAEAPVAASTTPSARVAAAPVIAEQAVPEQRVVVTSELYRYTFSTRGAALLRAELLKYPSYTNPGESVQLVPAGATDFLAHRVVVGNDTLDLRRAGFQPSATSLRVDGSTGVQTLRFTFGTPQGLGAEVVYTFRPDRYLVDVSGRLLGLNGRQASLLTHLGPGLATHEAVDHHTERELALVSRTTEDEVYRTRLQKLQETRRETLQGPLTWAGLKDKYFLAALLAVEGRPLSGAQAWSRTPVKQAFVSGGDTTVVELPRAEVVTALPVGADGRFAFRAYLGPQDYQQLVAAGHKLEDVTQYAYAWLEPVIRPFAAFILHILNFFHVSMGLAYGWVLLLFGVLMRLVLWPLNAKAMRSQMKTAAVAPLMQEVREKYRDDPEKQQQEMVRLYKEHGVNPLAGCLPMLLPWPVLITLFFVFQNTIAFRGAEFLWLPDLSLRDPLYILPVFLVLSMFAMQWVSTYMSGIEQTQQAKVMLYVMPVMLGVLFFNLPAGLNLYYATTNIAGLPQQMLIARERRKAQEETKRAAPAPAAAAAARRKRSGKG